ncbi:MAG TPA: type 1 glutamine amidotransferase [Desulfobacterales bacterium]|nr:type 1 glutamine amidotransferase [Desulfobacterales bacterium]HIP39285.1 type 1 glutamine amidotransferase [Desulfocapsa sulfexigens]
MSSTISFLIIDGYSKASRDDLNAAGMQLAWKLYGDMLQRNVPEADYDVLLPSDPGVNIPTEKELEKYSGILWTGCNLCIFDETNPSVVNQIALAKRCFEIGIPSFGSCWGLQVSVVAAGGKVAPNPKGKEMGIARKIKLTPEGKTHPLFMGKPPVFEAYISHDDMVTELPPGGMVLAGNDFTPVQALAVTHKKGSFWSVQYHPEYNLHEMACLIIAREKKLIELGFFRKAEELKGLVDKMKLLNTEPDRKDLRWQLVIDDDVLSDEIKECEFRNWISELVLPSNGEKQ